MVLLCLRVIAVFAIVILLGNMVLALLKGQWWAAGGALLLAAMLAHITALDELSGH